MATFGSRRPPHQTDGLLEAKNMASDESLAASTALNEHQQRHLLMSCKYIDKQLDEIESIALGTSSRSLFPRHAPTLTAVQRKLVTDYLARIRSRLLAVLESQGLHPPAPRGDEVFSIRTALTFVDIAIEELKPKYMRGYGEVPDTIVPQIDGIVDELRTIVQKLDQYLGEDAGHNLRARLSRLEADRDDVGSLSLLERIITSHGLVEFRPALARLVERASRIEAASDLAANVDRRWIAEAVHVAEGVPGRALTIVAGAEAGWRDRGVLLSPRLALIVAAHQNMVEPCGCRRRGQEPRDRHLTPFWGDGGPVHC